MIENKRCILIADDEKRMVRAVKDFLTAQNFHILEAYDGEEALNVYFQHNQIIDLILLDVMMPVYNGMEVLKKLRDESCMTPIIMLTARGEEYDQVAAFKNGADDYITKPFSPTLLLLRIEAMLKRVGKGLYEEISCGPITVNATLRNVFCDKILLELTKREFDLILFFVSNKNMIFTREQLLDSVWGYGFEGDSRTVDTHIKQLRIKLGEHSSMIKTVHRVGYKLEVENEDNN